MGDTPNIFSRLTEAADMASRWMTPPLALAGPAVPTPTAPSQQGSRRRRLWDLPSAAMCPVIGVCVPMPLLRRRLGKILGASADNDDYALHCCAINECSGQRSAVASALQRELDQRYAVALRQFNAHKTTNELAAAWATALHSSDIAGSFWATLTHARCDAALQEQVLRDIHMLQHQVGAANRADLQRLEAVSDENVVLTRELGKVQARSTRLLNERAAQADALQATLMRLRGELMSRDALIASLQDEVQQLEAATPGLRQQQQQNSRQAHQAEQLRQQQTRIHELERALLAARQHAERRAPGVVEGPPPAPSTGSGPAASASCPDLGDQSVLCVGGRQGVVPIYRQLIERTGGRFLHHDGGEEHAVAQLDASLAAADLVICQTGCISHDAYWRVKDHCKRTGKRCVFVDKPSASSLQRALGSLGSLSKLDRPDLNPVD